jgi:peroxiredoxin Q/BCP
LVKKTEGNIVMLEQGSKAPDFTLSDQFAKKHTLSDYHGKWVVLYFYPKDMTPGCTIEACNFRDEFPNFQNLNAVILGISKDSVKRHATFADKYKLTFPVLSDSEGDVCEKYQVWKKKSLYGKSFMGIVRSTYLIDPSGKIARVYPKVKVKEHAAELLHDLQALS